MAAARVQTENLTLEALEERAVRNLTSGLRELVRAEVKRFAELAEYYTAEQPPWPVGSTEKDRQRSLRRFNKLARSGKVPAVKVNERWQILKADYRAYLEKYGERKGRRAEDETVEDYIERVNSRGSDR